MKRSVMLFFAFALLAAQAARAERKYVLG